MIKSALADPQRYDLDSTKLRQLDKLVNRIDGKIFNGVIFRVSLTSISHTTKSIIIIFYELV